ncbi:RNA polymerase I upstream activation factor complex subunit Rrn7 [Schizosaccharomyces cryophilus OY26]|uniref:RNA polymerase I upstream activation factor complex subunit Rrn7 n=1 Tax=Schizosaccharomyces cryophilus (strain OY26 / ATCC MYA-4695 / CBS 11777 / NBRC 106824 / NRRL Y48691) TaxID=653667 RepID=S9W5E0_SCHCR|nr:RNA polymerase I upstream activation factor complex subunit Rrn7 [Schizosaccharomyces cryophilus OY26]EPY53784.1 RNA polymerase I upstream activation factor complex subunit Rrn7 [Schizosaccharomyces cryophilus OY26]
MDGNWFQGPPCPIRNCKCIWYFTNEGQTVCRRGHIQHGMEIAQDDEPGSGVFYQTRKRKVLRKHLDTGDSQEPLYGAAGRDLYFQVYQTILQTQCNALVSELKFPQTIEGLVRDLWGLYLSFAYESFSSSYLSFNKDLSLLELSDSELDMEDPDTQTSNTSEVSKSIHRDQSLSYPKLLYSPAFIYISCFLLRLPITLHQIRRWIRADTLPYYKAYKIIPSQVVKRLPINYVRMLVPYHYPSYHRLQGAVSTILQILIPRYSIQLPPINVSLVLLDTIKFFIFPVELFLPAIRLIYSLNLPMSLGEAHRQASVLPQASAPFKSTSETSTNPELMILAALVVSANILYGFERSTPSNSIDLEDSIIIPDWKNWIESILRLRKASQESFMEMDEYSMHHLDNNEIDDYMNWYERQFLDDENPNQLPQGILDLFSVSSSGRPESASQDKNTETSGMNSELSLKTARSFKVVQKNEANFQLSSLKEEAYLPMFLPRPDPDSISFRVVSTIAKLYDIKTATLITAIRYVEQRLKQKKQIK